MRWNSGWFSGRHVRRGVGRRIWLVGMMMWIGVLGGCLHGDTAPPDLTYISPRLQPGDVLKNLTVAYKYRNITEYARLLADDFTFCFDPATRLDPMPECWDRAADSTATARLFAAADISDIRIVLTYGESPVHVNEPGKESWLRLRITDTFLEVDKVPPTAEVITYRVDGDVQDFYLRMGRTPTDTLATSPTAKEWFLVQWNDLGRNSLRGAPAASGLEPTVQTTTWGSIKYLYAN